MIVWSWIHENENFYPFSDDKFCQFTTVPTIPASEAAVELQTLIFEARSAKDYAWWVINISLYMFCFSAIYHLYTY